MATNSRIEWTEMTWNPVTGCTKVSQGCKNCYAERMAGRLKAMGSARYRNGFGLTLHRDLVELPKNWKRGRMVFVNSMSDLFHKAIPTSFVDSVFDTMERADWHVFQVLTKRSSLLRRYVNARYVDRAPPHIWLGVSIEDRGSLVRLRHLLESKAAVRFVSFEPLLEALGQMDLSGIDWAIVGGESGFGARPMKREWVISIRKQCRKYGIPFFFKQWGGVHKAAAGRKLDGRTYDEMPSPVAAGTACFKGTKLGAFAAG